VPYIGIFIATIPPTFLALTEFGPGRALLVVVGITVINVGIENTVFPRMVGKSLSLPTTVVFLSFFLWLSLLGAPGPCSRSSSPYWCCWRSIATPRRAGWRRPLLALQPARLGHSPLACSHESGQFELTLLRVPCTSALSGVRST
jgi:hypothetical protein